MFLTVMRQWVLSLALFIGVHAATAQELHLAANENALEQQVAMLLLADIYAKTGMKADIEPLPGKRANLLALDGTKDGEVARIAPYAERNPPLLRVDPPYYHLSTAVFARTGRKLAIKDKADFARYRVGVVRGIAHAEKAVEGLENVTMVDKYEQLYRMIDAGRIDLGVDTGINGVAEIQRLGLSKNVEQVGDIAGYDLHHILHPRHAALIPLISATIKAM